MSKTIKLPLPCPFCGRINIYSTRVSCEGYAEECGNRRCRARGPIRKSATSALKAWDKAALAVIRGEGR